jgi:competence protein ComEA
MDASQHDSDTARDAGRRIAMSLLFIGLSVWGLCHWAPTPQSGVPPKPRLRIDPNQAAAEEFRLLPGVGPRLAERIVEYRQQAGEIRTAEDLLDVPGIGPQRVAQIREYLRFEPPGETVAAEPSGNGPTDSDNGPTAGQKGPSG